MAKTFKPNFKNLDRDIERYLDLHGRKAKWGQSDVVFGYQKAIRSVFDLYMEAGAYDAIVHYLLTCRNNEAGLNDYFLETSARLYETRQASRLMRLWRGAIAVQRQHFWDLMAHRNLPKMEASIAAAKAQALDSMDRFRGLLDGLEETEALALLDAETALLREERRKRLKDKPLNTAMTEDLFWRLIAESAEAAETQGEQVAVLTEGLARFKSSQIKVFQTRLSAAMDEANHFDLWALAYLVQDGCSDDAFEGFRAWLILQGREAFNLAFSSAVQFLRQVPLGSHNDAAALLQVPAIAYEWRSGKVLKPGKRPVGKLKGKAWDEDDLCRRYPDLVEELARLR